MTSFKKRLLRTAALCLLVLLILASLGGCSVSGNRSEYISDTQSEEGTQEPQAPQPKRPRVALTFDDGPHNVRTKLIVDELNKYGYHATFFVVGNRVDGTEYRGGDAMVYAAQNGNEIGIHGYTHEMSVKYSSCSDERYEYEISNTARAILEKLPDYEIRLMRPIGGAISEQRVRESPYAIINWSVDTLDYTFRSPEGDADQINAIVQNALADVSDGDIILMHDIYNNTYEATVIILARLHEMGFDVVTVSELLGEELSAGVRYTRGKKN